MNSLVLVGRGWPLRLLYQIESNVAKCWRRHVLFLVMSQSASAIFAQQSIVYTPIPPGFDFPADQQVLLKMLDAGDVAGIRTHAWLVFAGLTQPAVTADPEGEPIWETWYTGVDVFATPPAVPTPQGLHPRTFKPVFTIPRQFLPIRGQPNLQATGAALASFTLFNKETMDHVQTKGYQMRSTLKALNDGWTSVTPVSQRTIAPFPKAAMSLKLVWWVVRARTPTPMPIWDQKPAVANSPAEPPSKWSRAVIVDPTRRQIPVGESRDTSPLFGKVFKNAPVVSLQDFYHFELTTEQAQQLREILVGEIPGLKIDPTDPNLKSAKAGDYLALVAMHYTTKEIPNWVWATFWWHDKPDVGPFAQDRPDVTKLKEPWRNYLMDVTMDMTRPVEADKTPHITFNPWLEAKFPNGTNSNCMACHQLAVWENRRFLPVVRGPISFTDPRFTFSDDNNNEVTLDHGTSVDFLWSLLFEGDH